HHITFTRTLTHQHTHAQTAFISATHTTHTCTDSFHQCHTQDTHDTDSFHHCHTQETHTTQTTHTRHRQLSSVPHTGHTQQRQLSSVPHTGVRRVIKVLQQRDKPPA